MTTTEHVPSDQSLRVVLDEALNLADTYERMGLGSASNFDKGAQRAAHDIGLALRRVLAAHPDEPAPVGMEITDEAVHAARAAAGIGEAVPGTEQFAWMQRALEAARPFMTSRPALDREKVEEALRSNLTVNEYGEVSAVGTTAAVDAVMALAVPVPTREQIELAIETVATTRGVNWRWTRTQAEKDAVYEAVLALLNGSAK